MPIAGPACIGSTPRGFTAWPWRRARRVRAYHGVGDEGVPTRDIAEVIGRRLNLPVRSLSADEARAPFRLDGFFLAMDLAASSALTRERLGWQPTQPGLLADLDRNITSQAEDDGRLTRSGADAARIRRSRPRAASQPRAHAMIRRNLSRARRHMLRLKASSNFSARDRVG